MENYNKISFLILLILSSCGAGVFKNDLPDVLNIREVQILSIDRIDVSGGLRKSYLMEIYELSPNTIGSFIESEKILPDNQEYGPWEKYGWFSSSDSISKNIELITLASDWGNKRLGVQLDTINSIIKNERGYFAFYCKPTIEEPEYVRLFVLDTFKNILYIMDSNM